MDDAGLAAGVAVTAAERTGQGERPRDFTFVVPNDWARVRVGERADREADVRRIAGVVTAGRPDRDSMFPQVARLLHEAVDGYVREHTVEVYLSLLQLGGLPVACAMAVDVVPPGLTGGSPDQQLAAFLSTAGPTGTAEVVELLCGPVPRVRRRRTSPLPGSPEPVESEVVQYQYAIAGGGFVLLTFATPQLQLLEPLGAIFDAVAGSFRWIP